MDEQVKMEMAQNVFGALCRHMDQNNLKYNKDEQKLQVDITFSGEDIPVNMQILVDAKRRMIRIFSPLPFAMEEGKRLESAVAISTVNYKLVDGCFDYNLADGSVSYRAVAFYGDAAVEDEVFRYLISITLGTVDEYNDKLLMLNKGMWTIEDFLKSTMSND